MDVELSNLGYDSVHRGCMESIYGHHCRIHFVDMDPPLGLDTLSQNTSSREKHLGSNTERSDESNGRIGGGMARAWFLFFFSLPVSYLLVLVG